jgi:hypothetical protein
MLRLLKAIAARSWHYSLGYDQAHDFCVWALERDGLRVPPFDRHPAGDGTLRAAGLDAVGWWRWLARVDVAARDFGRQLASAPPWPDMVQPAAWWDGAPEVGRRLEALGEEWDELWSDRKELAYPVEYHLQQRERDRPTWDELAPYRRTLPPVRVILVAYPGPAQTVIPPATVLIASGGWLPTSPELAAAMLTGMDDLASVRRRRFR